MRDDPLAPYRIDAPLTAEEQGLLVELRRLGGPTYEAPLVAAGAHFANDAEDGPRLVLSGADPVLFPTLRCDALSG